MDTIQLRKRLVSQVNEPSHFLEPQISFSLLGEINYEDIDGGNVIVSLKGRFWHATDTVMMRVESFLKQRIPEIIEVVLDKDKSIIIDDNRLNTEGMAKSSKKLF